MRNIFSFLGFIILFGCGSDVIQSPQTETEQEQNYPRAGKLALGPLREITVSLRRIDAAASVDVRPATIRVALSDTLPEREVLWVAIYNKKAGLLVRSVRFAVGDTLAEFSMSYTGLAFNRYYDADPPYKVKISYAENHSNTQFVFADSLCIYGPTADCGFKKTKMPVSVPDVPDDDLDDVETMDPPNTDDNGGDPDVPDDSGDADTPDTSETVTSGGGSGGSGSSTPTVDSTEPRWLTITRNSPGSKNYTLTLDRPFDYNKAIRLWYSCASPDQSTRGKSLTIIRRYGNHILENGRCVENTDRSREFSLNNGCATIPAGETSINWWVENGACWLSAKRSVTLGPTPGVMTKQGYYED